MAAVEAPESPEPAVRRKRLVVFSDDWGRHPSSAQHLIRVLLAKYDVDWINTVGTRRLRFTASDLRRAGEKIAGWAQPNKSRVSGQRPAIATGPRVRAPIHWPGFGNRLERWLNGRLLMRALRDVLCTDPLPDAVITTLPITADLARATPQLNWIYYCVDDLSEWPGLDREALVTMERAQLGAMKTIIVASDVLGERIRALGRDAGVLTHGIDLANWRRVQSKASSFDGRHVKPPRPIALFWGYADGRLDPDICLELAERCEFRIVGPRGSVDPRIGASPNIVWRKPVPYERLWLEADEADVLVMPYADLPVTRAMQPLKLKEYLATGRPVVATPIPANLDWADAMDLTAAPRDFVDLCLHRARHGTPAQQVAARARLSCEAWENKAEQFETLLFGPAPLATP